MPDLEHDIRRLRFGDLVRIPRQKTWWVVVGKETGGLTGARVQTPRDLGPRLEIVVDDRAFERAGPDPFAYTQARLFDPASAKRKTVAPPLERVPDPARFLRLQPPTPEVFALLAWHTRDPQMELERIGFGLVDAVARVLKDAGAGEVDTLA